MTVWVEEERKGVEEQPHYTQISKEMDSNLRRGRASHCSISGDPPSYV